MNAQNRNYTIDICRLIASFCVVALHVRLNIDDTDTLAAIKLACRWAVPFFFLVSGYFYQPSFAKDPSAAFVRTCTRLVKLFLLTSFIFLPFTYQRTGLLFKFSYLYQGTHLHLWFLPSMISGFVFWYVLGRFRLPDSVLLVIAGLVALFVLFKDSYANLVPGLSAPLNHHKRMFVSIPLLFLGIYIRKHEVAFLRHNTWVTGLAMVLGGYGLQLLEAYGLAAIKQYPIGNHQFLVGTFLMALGVFIITLTVHSAKSTLSTWGEAYSLLIYLYHPLFVFLVMALTDSFGILVMVPLIQVPLVFGLTLFFVDRLYHFLPTVFAFLSASFWLPFEKQNLMRSWRT